MRVSETDQSGFNVSVIWTQENIKSLWHLTRLRTDFMVPLALSPVHMREDEGPTLWENWEMKAIPPGAPLALIHTVLLWRRKQPHLVGMTAIPPGSTPLLTLIRTVLHPFKNLPIV